MTPENPTGGRALVLGAGGVVGIAWLAGLAAGLRDAGVDLAAAERLVGTSAGAVVGAVLRTGQDLERLAAPPRGPDAAAASPDFSLMAQVFAVLGDPARDRADARREVGALALAADALPAETHVARMGAIVEARDWPAGDLRVTTVDVETGERRVWDRTDGVPLVDALAASTAVPGASKPVPLGGRRYMDGAIGFGANADVAAGAGTLVLIEPLAHLMPPGPLPDDAVRIGPDAASREAFGTDFGDLARWPGAYRAGRAQAAEAVEILRPAW
ncbi:patatin-like phospholipase family protein [Spirillospora sp. NPDC127200]